MLLAQGGGAAGLLGWAAFSPCREGNAGKWGAAQAECGQWGGPHGEVESSALDGGSNGQSLSVLRAGSTVATLGWCELGFGVVGDIGQVGWQGGSLPD